jgi:flagellar hook-associated protein 3 FlgL
MNTSLANLMETNIQGATQQRINKPSDDPAGLARVMLYQTSLANITQYKSNLGAASGWLETADKCLSTQVNSVITQLMTYAEQAATGTLTADNREQISYALRGLMSELVGLANTEFEGQHIFAGTQTTYSAYQESLYAHSYDPNLADCGYVVEGGASYTTIIQFTSSGVTGDGTALDFQYSQDGGKTWLSGSAATATDALGVSTTEVNAGGVRVVIPAGKTITAVDTAPAPAAKDINHSNPGAGGTWLYVRPTAQYMGDDKDMPHYPDASGANPQSKCAYWRGWRPAQGCTASCALRWNWNCCAANWGRSRCSSPPESAPQTPRRTTKAGH